MKAEKFYLYHFKRTMNQWATKWNRIIRKITIDRQGSIVANTLSCGLLV